MKTNSQLALLFAFLIIGVQTLISCSSDDSGDGNETSSSSIAGTQSSSSDANPSSSSIGECVGADNICPSSSSGDVPSSSSVHSSSSVVASSSSSEEQSSSSNGNSSSSSLSIGSPFQVNSQIYFCDDEYGDCETASPQEYTGSGIIKIRFRDNDCTAGDDCYYDENSGRYYFLMDAGTVTNGIVNLNLPSTIPDKYLNNFNFASGINVVPSDVKGVGSEEQFYLFTGTDAWQIVIASKQRTENTRKEEMIFHMYFSKAATITGAYTENEGCRTNEMIYDIDAKAGWNMTHLSSERTEISSSCRNAVDIVSTNNILTTDVKWIIDPMAAQ